MAFEKLGLNLKIDFSFGRVLPENLKQYKLAIHCGGCMADRQKYSRRIIKLEEAGVPVTNYGLAIAHSLGILERALSPFPTVLDAFRKAKHGQAANPALA